MHDPSKRHIQLTSLEGKRFKHVGNIGETLAKCLLKKNGFCDIKNLNDIKKNFKFADFNASKDEIKFIISVKTRNKYENNGKINYRYESTIKT